MKAGFVNLVLLCLSAVDSKPAFLQALRPVLCEYNGLTFSPGEDRYLDHEGCEITVVTCGTDGKVELAHKYDCDITSTKVTQTTTSTTTTHSTLGPVCWYEGVYYRPGETIHETSHDDRCFGVYCSPEAGVLSFNVECNSTKPASTQQTPVTQELPQSWCVVDGMIYDEGEVIAKYQHKENCVETFCGQHGVVEKREEETTC